MPLYEEKQLKGRAWRWGRAHRKPRRLDRRRAGARRVARVRLGDDEQPVAADGAAAGGAEAAQEAGGGAGEGARLAAALGGRARGVLEVEVGRALREDGADGRVLGAARDADGGRRLDDGDVREARAARERLVACASRRGACTAFMRWFSIPNDSEDVRWTGRRSTPSSSILKRTHNARPGGAGGGPECAAGPKCGSQCA